MVSAEQEVCTDTMLADSDEVVVIKGAKCHDCGCFHYKKDEFIIHEYTAYGDRINNAIANWVTDEQLAKEKRNETK